MGIMKFEEIKKDQWFHVRYQEKLSMEDSVKQVIITYPHSRNDIIALVWDKEQYIEYGTAMERIFKLSDFMGPCEDPRVNVKKEMEKEKKISQTFFQKAVQYVKDTVKKIEFI